MKQRSYKRKLSVILSADVKGYSLLMRLNEEATVRTLTKYRALIAELCAKYQGRIVDSPGDNILAEFDSVVHAVQCSFDIQASLKVANTKLSEDRRMEFRIGINLGDVIQDGERIYGDGVNIAARVESLAEAGGICVTGSAYDQIENKFRFACEYLGEHTVKNISTPVRVYRLSSGETGKACTIGKQGRKASKHLGLAVAMGLLILSVAFFLIWNNYQRPAFKKFESASVDDMAHPLPDKPSIAVLPFENLSEDNTKGYFADGITADIITDLTKVSGLFVIDQNSTFAYKGTPVKIRQVAEDLGVQYVLKGSVRRSMNRIRITAQLIDAIKGNLIWAERYDRRLEDVFAIQSEVAQKVSKALTVTINASEYERIFLKHTTSIEAYDVFLQARRMVDAVGRESVERAEKLFRKVIELDPSFASAYAGLSFNYSVKARFNFTERPQKDAKTSLEFARKAIELDKELAWGYIALGGAHLALGDPGTAVDAVRRALAIQPNGYEANLFMGLYLQFAGQPGKAIEHLERAQRLNPVDTVRKLAFLGFAYFMNGDYEKSEAIFRKRLEKFPVKNELNFIFYAASLAMLGRIEDAARHAEMVVRLNPDFKLSSWRWILTYKSPDDRRHLYDAAKRAGIPE